MVTFYYQMINDCYKICFYKINYKILIVRILSTVWRFWKFSRAVTNSFSHFIITSPSAVGEYISIVNDTIGIEYSIYKYKKYNYDSLIYNLLIVTKYHFKKLIKFRICLRIEFYMFYHSRLKMDVSYQEICYKRS